MNSPGTRSAPGPAFIRPNSTVPNTTSSRPATTASTRAHATWNTVAGLTPSRRATLPHPPRQRRRPPAGAACAAAPPSGARPAARTAPSARSRRPAARRSTARAPPAESPAGPGPRSPGTAAAPAARPSRPASSAAISRSTTSSAGVVLHQVMDLQQRQPPRRRPGSAAVHAAAAAPGPGPSADPTAASSPATGSARAGQLHLGHRQLGLPPHHLHRLGQPLPHHRGPEDVMPVDHPPQRRRKAVQPAPATSNRSTNAPQVHVRAVRRPASRWWKNMPSCSGASG